MSAENWLTLMQASGAQTGEDGIPAFLPPAEEIRQINEGNTITDLSHIGFIRASGEDLVTFLQGQLSNDIRNLQQNKSQLSSYCTPKGRMLALFRLFRQGETVYLSTDHRILESVLKRLRMYVLRSKVTLEVAEEWHSFGLSGPDAETLICNIMDSPPREADEVAIADGLLVLRVPGDRVRYQISGPIDKLSAAWKQLQQECKPAGSAAWLWLDIMGGQPWISSATSEAFVPQMANLELINGVNFKKGCYPGQEIVARMQYLGKLKQRMYRMHTAAEAAPTAGQAIYSSAFPGQSAGTIVLAEPAPGNGYDLLVVAQIKAVESGDLHLVDENGPNLTVESLPYPLEAKTA